MKVLDYLKNKKRIFFNFFKYFKKYYISIPLILFAFIIVIFFVRNQSLISQYIVNNDSFNINSNLITISSAVLGTIAIIFALSIFAIELASSKYSSTILNKFTIDNRVKGFYIATSLIVIILFILSFLDFRKFSSYLIVISLLLIVFFLFLLWFYYRYIVNLINPFSQILYYYNITIRHFKTINKFVNKTIKTITKDKKKEAEIVEPDKIKASIFFDSYDLFKVSKDSIEQIHNIISVYINNKDYKIINSGLNSIALITHNYINVRGKTFYPSVEVPDLDYSHDDFLINILEKLKDLFGLALAINEIETIKLILNCYENIALSCLNVRYVANPRNEKTHTTIVAGYMMENIEKSLIKNIFDVGIAGSTKIGNLGISLLKSDCSDVNIMSIFNNLHKISDYGIVKNINFLTNHVLGNFSAFLKYFLFSAKSSNEFLIKDLLKNVMEIIKKVIRFENLTASNKLKESIEIQHSVGNFIDIVNNSAIPNFFNDAYNLVLDESITEENKSKVLEKMVEFQKELWRFYDEISKVAVENNSFVLQYVNLNIKYITITSLDIWHTSYLDGKEELKTEILKNIGWLISDYWRIFSYYKEISDYKSFKIVESLLEIGYKLNVSGLLEQLNEVIKDLVYISTVYLEKSKDNINKDPLSIIQDTANLVILSNNTEAKLVFFDKLKKDYWSKYIEKYPDKKELLFERLLETKPWEAQYSSISLISIREKIKSELDENKISEFVEMLKNEINK